MITADQFLNPCLEFGFNFFTGTPCSYLKPFINYVIDHKEFAFVDSVNEGEAVALAAGMALGGRRSVVMFQNSGFGNAVNPLTSLTWTFRIPVLVIVTFRGEPGGAPDEPQHELMGQIMTDMLDTMQMAWEYFPNQPDQVLPALQRADAYMKEHSLPYVFVMRKDDVQPYELQSRAEKHDFISEIHNQDAFTLPYEQRARRTDALAAIQQVSTSGTVVIATTGKTGRELYELEDRENQLYMVGSMGCALALGMGIAMARPDLKKVYVIDGDGALLMRTGSMATAGAYRPANLTHILIDNEAHDSTGGQSTVSGGISFTTIAKGFGYPYSQSTDNPAQFAELLAQDAQRPGTSFIHYKIQMGSPKTLGRPGIKPYQVAERLADYLRRQ